MGRRCSGQYSPPDNTAPAQPIEALMEGRFCRGYVWTAGMRQDTRHALNHLSTLCTVERDGEEVLRKRGPVFVSGILLLLGPLKGKDFIMRKRLVIVLDI